MSVLPVPDNPGPRTTESPTELPNLTVQAPSRTPETMKLHVLQTAGVLACQASVSQGLPRECRRSKAFKDTPRKPHGQAAQRQNPKTSWETGHNEILEAPAVLKTQVCSYSQVPRFWATELFIPYRTQLPARQTALGNALWKVPTLPCPTRSC